MPPDGPVLIAGGGIAGLTAALAFAQRGFAVEVFERAARLDEAGAGIQLSPNATRILFSLGLRDALLAVAPRPEAVSLIDAKTLRELAHVPLGAWGAARWGAPYLTCRRAELQRILLDAVRADSRVTLWTGAAVIGADFSGASPKLILSGQPDRTASGAFLVAADGVHSALRNSLMSQTVSLKVVPPLRLPSAATSPPSGGRGKPKFAKAGALPLPPEGGEVAAEGRRSGGTTSTISAPSEDAAPKPTGLTAWRATVDQGVLPSDVAHANRVSAFLHPQAHLVAYPTGKERFNLVAFSATRDQPGSLADADAFNRAFSSAAPDLMRLISRAAWTAWPLLTAPDNVPWTFASFAALIGDAAHAMTPFAAQGAAMAIEDAATLAATAAATGGMPPEASLASWETERSARIAKVVRRGRLNRLTWHASGPVALGRNLVLKLLPPQKLAADLDWLYGWKPDQPLR